jgi:hypothetical protein
MKKRKPPIVLATLLLVLLGAFIIINQPASSQSPQNTPPHDDGPAESQPGAKPGELANEIKQGVNGSQQGLSPVAGAQGPRMLTPPGSKVTIPEMKPWQPKPDPNSTYSLRTDK